MRRRADLSQRQLAALAGVPASTVARIESGYAQDPRFRTVERLLRAGGLSLSVVGSRVAWWIDFGTPGNELRDAAGRRYPAHLDVHEVRDPRDWSGAWWANEYLSRPEMWPVEVPPYSFDLSRPDRDRRRRRVLAAGGMRIERVRGLPDSLWQLVARTSTDELIGAVRAVRWRPPGGWRIDTAGEALLVGFEVVPDCRRAGVGGKLLAAMVELLQECGVSAVHVLDEGGLNRFWRRLGFLPARRDLRLTRTFDETRTFH